MDLSHIIPGLRALAVHIDDLVEDPDNARVHGAKNLAAIRASMERYGQVKPIAARRADMVVLAGNGRLQVARELGWDCLAVVLMDGTAEDLRAFALLDNRASDLAEWDEAALADILAGLARDNEDLGAYGWNQAELDALVDQEEATITEEAAHVQAPEPTPTRERGDAPDRRPAHPAPGQHVPDADGGRAPPPLALAEGQAARLEEAARLMREEKGDPHLPLGEVVRILAKRYVLSLTGGAAG